MFPFLFRTTRRRAPALAASLPCLWAALSVTPAVAQEWSWSATPYLFGAGLKGTVATVPGAPPVGVDASFGDLLSNLDMAAMIVVNGNNGRWGISGDLQYIKLSASTASTAPGFARADIKARQTVATLLGEYLLSGGPQHQLWAAGGIRYWDVSTTITLLPGTSGPGGTTTGSDSWVDPVIGLRGRYDLNGDLFLTGWAYAGGFGVGADAMGDVFGGVGYDFSDSVSGAFGYRWMSVDRVSGGFVYDVTQQGPIAGVAFRF